tara:strand:- start:294 stop:677 length:384 start_codon:yes stop_codon:yes gene_type:complete
MKLQTILSVVESEFNCKLKIKTRKRDLVYQRAVYYQLCRDLTKLGVNQIGQSLGFHHATVLHSLKTFHKLDLWGEKKYLDAYNKLKNKLYYDRHIRTPEQFCNALMHKNINLKGKIQQLETQLKNLS